MIRILLLLFCTLALSSQEVRIQVLSTSDLHGRIQGRDPFTLQPMAQGWARLASLIRAKKAANSETILVDCGDTLAGDPVNYVRNRLKPELPEPSVAIMNALGFNAMTVGNHEYDYGFPILRQAEEQAKFPFLSANTVYADSGKPAFTPYAMLEVSGLRVAILGLTMAAVKGEPRNLEGLKFLDPVETAQSYVPKLRGNEKADLVLVAIHGGLGKEDGGALSGAPVQALAHSVKGIDLILAGHTHESLATRVEGVPVLQAKDHGQALGIAEISVRQVKHTFSANGWSVQDCQLHVEPVTLETPEDGDVLSLSAPARSATEAYLNTFVTNLSEDLDSRWAWMEDTSLLQLYHQVMRKAVGAQLSAASSPGSRIFIPKGPTSVRQFFALAPTEDRVARIAVTGAQLRAYLEHAAKVFAYSFDAQLFTPGARPQDFDTLSGVTYALDLGKPAGQRVARLDYQGTPVKDVQVFTLAISTSRLNGSGGYLAAMGFKGEPERISAQSLRNLILEYALGKGTLSLSPVGNWRTIPYLDRERVLVQLP